VSHLLSLEPAHSGFSLPGNATLKYALRRGSHLFKDARVEIQDATRDIRSTIVYNTGGGLAVCQILDRNYGAFGQSFVSASLGGVRLCVVRHTARLRVGTTGRRSRSRTSSCRGVDSCGCYVTNRCCSRRNGGCGWRLGGGSRCRRRRRRGGIGCTRTTSVGLRIGVTRSINHCQLRRWRVAGAGGWAEPDHRYGNGNDKCSRAHCRRPNAAKTGTSMISTMTSFELVLQHCVSLLQTAQNLWKRANSPIYFQGEGLKGKIALGEVARFMPRRSSCYRRAIDPSLSEPATQWP
jgi:hypothetical protein